MNPFKKLASENLASERLVYGLHGFLGTWQEIDFLLAPLFNPSQIKSVDLYQYSKLSLQEFAAKFNGDVEQDLIKQKPVQQKENDFVSPLIFGYSLGARLTLEVLRHSFDNQLKLWAGAVIVSAGSGLKSEAERKERLARDADLSLKFRTEEWNHLMDLWEGLPVFSNASYRPKREEKSYKRENLSAILEEWSLVNQRDMKGFIEEVNLPILWMTGDDDKNYQTMAKSIVLRHPLSKKVSLAQAGHRAPWENSVQFKEEVQMFYQRLTEKK